MQKYTEHRAVHMTPEMYDELARQARFEDRSMGHIVRQAIKWALKAGRRVKE